MSTRTTEWRHHPSSVSGARSRQPVSASGRRCAQSEGTSACLSGGGGRTRTPRGCSDHSSGARAPGSRARRCEGRGAGRCACAELSSSSRSGKSACAFLACGPRGGRAFARRRAPELAPIARDLRDGVAGVVVVPRALGAAPERGASGGPARDWLPRPRGRRGVVSGRAKRAFRRKREAREASWTPSAVRERGGRARHARAVRAETETACARRRGRASRYGAAPAEIRI